VAHPTIRNRGTTVGSLVHADPAAEMPAVLCLLDGSVETFSTATGQRTIPAAELVVGPMESALRPDELATAATFRHPPELSGCAWLEVSRRHGDYAVVGVGAVIMIDHTGHLEDGRLAFVGVGPGPMVVEVGPALLGRDTETLASGQADLDDLKDLVSAALSPESDIHASAEYRAHLARTLGARAAVAACRQATGWTPDRPVTDGNRRPRHRGRS
jgi:carbon-monoxide dehydrogenase medium subunit